MTSIQEQIAAAIELALTTSGHLMTPNERKGYRDAATIARNFTPTDDGATVDEAAVTLSVPSEDAMFDLLSALNQSSITPELPCVWVKDVGGAGGKPNLAVAPFLATLTDPDAGHVNYISSDESGRSRCTMQCDDCGSGGEKDWEPPSYPVTALVADWPDEERCRENEIEMWWIAATVPTSPTEPVDQAAWSESDRRDVATWLIREADRRVHLFPQRRDGVDALIRHLAWFVPTSPTATGGEHQHTWGEPIEPDTWRCPCGATCRRLVTEGGAERHEIDDPNPSPPVTVTDAMVERAKPIVRDALWEYHDGNGTADSIADVATRAALTAALTEGGAE